MNEHEAHLNLVWHIRDILMDLANDGTEENVAELYDAMTDTAEIIIDALNLTIKEVNGKELTVGLTLPSE